MFGIRDLFNSFGSAFGNNRRGPGIRSGGGGLFNMLNPGYGTVLQPPSGGYSNSGRLGYLDSLLRTAGRPAPTQLTRQVPETYIEQEKYQKPDYYNYVFEHDDLRRAFEQSNTAADLIDAARNQATGDFDQDNLDKKAWGEAARKWGEDHYGTHGEGEGRTLNNYDAYRDVQKERLVDELYDDPDFQPRATDTSVADYTRNRLYNDQPFFSRSSFGMPNFGQGGAYGAQRSSPYSYLSELLGGRSRYNPPMRSLPMPETPYFQGGGRGMFRLPTSRGFDQPARPTSRDYEHLSKRLQSGQSSLLSNLFGGAGQALNMGEKPDATFSPLDRSDEDYAKSFKADNLFGFNPYEIRASGRNRNKEGFKPFEISDDQVNNYFGSQSQEFQDSWDNYRPKEGAFGGKNQLWDYDNDTLNRREVMRQNLRNNLAGHESSDFKLGSGLRSMFG